MVTKVKGNAQGVENAERRLQLQTPSSFPPPGLLEAGSGAARSLKEPKRTGATLTRPAAAGLSGPTDGRTRAPSCPSFAARREWVCNSRLTQQSFQNVY